MAKLTAIEKIKVAFDILGMKVHYATVSFNDLTQAFNKKENN